MSELAGARVATIGLFFLTGFALATWVVNIPAVQAQTGVSHAVLGSVLLALGLGQVTGMQAAGWIADRRGSRFAATFGVALVVVGVNLPGVATAWWSLAGGLLVFGVGYGIMNVAANDQAIIVERRYGRPIMASFHAFFSIAGALGAGVAALCQALRLNVHVPLGIGSVVALLIGVWSVRHLLVENGPGSRTDMSPDAVPRPVVLRRAIVLGSMAFLLMLAEGTAGDRSALHAVEHLAQSESAASLSYVAFAVAMTAGRLTVDRLVARYGPVAIVRFGSALAAAGMLTVTLAPSFPIALAGWLIFGLGLSGIVPQIFTAAGNLPIARRAIVLSRVVGAGYVGLLAGPAVIGWVAGVTGLDAALFLPVLFCALGVVLAGSVRELTPAADRKATPRR